MYAFGVVLSFSRLLTTRAHRAGLAIAQKNLSGLARRQRMSIGFDFAVAEEYAQYGECGRYRAAYGGHAIEIEYADNGRAAFVRACRHHGDAWSVVYRDRDRDLVRPSNPRYRYDYC